MAERRAFSDWSQAPSDVGQRRNLDVALAAAPIDPMEGGEVESPERNPMTDHAEPSRADEEPAPPSGRVLIVDDDPDFLAIGEASLRALGFRVDRAAGGLRGVFLATQDVPDAILCDLRMPGIDGFVVAEALRADPATERTVIVACTGRKDLEARALIRSAAFDAVRIKPVDWEEIGSLLLRAIADRRGPGGTPGTEGHGSSRGGGRTEGAQGGAHGAA
jgi:CheY-like chemotaxis protein